MRLIFKVLVCLLGLLPAAVVTAIVFATDLISGALVSVFFLAILVTIAVFYFKGNVKREN